MLLYWAPCLPMFVRWFVKIRAQGTVFVIPIPELAFVKPFGCPLLATFGALKKQIAVNIQKFEHNIKYFIILFIYFQIGRSYMFL